MAELRIDTVRLQTEVMGQTETFVRAFVDRSVTQSKQLAPTRTGNLRRLIVADPVRRTGPWTLESGISVNARYAAPVHEGARPHVIRARNAPALSFYWPRVGRQVFFASVNHPGNRPNPFVRNAVHRVASADPRITLGER